MTVSTPHYLLYSESNENSGVGRWRFVLRSADGAERLEADEVETDTNGERLQLLAVVRGLEALDQPSHVTLVTTSTYVREGIRHGVFEWRKNGWCWEFFGQMVPVKHQDLWKRVDHALSFHQVECRTMRVDSPHVVRRPSVVPRPHVPGGFSRPTHPVIRMPDISPTRMIHHSPSRLAASWKHWKQWLASVWLALAPTLRLG
jgi:ribonuclease HI